MRTRWLLVLGLFLLLSGRSARAVNYSSVRPNLPSSEDGQTTNLCNSSQSPINPQTVPYLSPSAVVQLATLTATDSGHNNYSVTVAAYNYGNQDCTSSTPKEYTGSGSNDYTILVVSVTTPTGAAVSGLALSAFDLQLSLTNPGFFVCGNVGLKLCDLPPSSSPGDNLLQPTPSPGADGTSTVWGFGTVYDITSSTPIILNSNYPAYFAPTPPYPIFGGVAVLSASGPICSATVTTGCNSITATTPYSVTFAPPGGLAAVTASTSNFVSLSPAPASVSAYNLKTFPLTVNAGTTPTSYNASGNVPTLTNGVPSPAMINGVAATTYTFPCSATTPTTLQQYLPVWFQFTATASSKVFVSTAESHYDTVLSVVSPATCDDDTTSTNGTVTSSLTFSATQGTTYQILATEYPPCTSQPSSGLYCTESSSGDDYVAPLSGDSTLYLLVNTPLVNYAPATLTAFASTLIGQTSAAQTITLSSNTANFGSTGITGITAATTGDFKVTPTSCTTPLPDSGPSCPLSVTFVPTASGTRTGTLVISSNGTTAAGNTPITLQLSGTGVTPAPAVSFSPTTTLTFTTPQVINTPSSVSDAVVTNTGTGPLTISAVAPSGDFSETNNCVTSSPIAANGTCTVMVTFTPTASGTRSGTLMVTDNAAGSPQSLGLSGTGILPSPTIMFPVANQTYGAAPFAVNATSNSTGTITYSVVSGNATISGNTVTLTGIGTVVLQASQAATSSYAAGTQNATFTVAAAAPTITFSVAGQIYGVVPFPVAASSNSLGTFTYSVVSGPATISGSMVTVTGVGTVVLQASEAAAGNYTAGSQNATFMVAAEAPTITFSVANHTYGNAPFTVSASSNSAGVFTYSVVSGPATVSGSTVTLTGGGTVVLQASEAAAGNYAAGTQNATFTVAPESQTISFTAPASPVNYGAAPLSLSATATSGLGVTFSIVSGPGTISGSTLTITGAGTVVVAANQSGNTSYSAAAQITQSITVNKAAPIVGLTASPNPVLLENSVTLTAMVTSSASTPTGSVVFSDGATTLGTSNLNAGVATLAISTLTAGSHSITAAYNGDGNFTAVTSTAFTETVQDFTLSVGGTGSSQTVLPGSTAAYTLPMAPSGGTTFPAAVGLSASGVPTGFTATFSPSSLAAGSSATNVTLMIQVPATAMLEKSGQPGRALAVVAFALLLPFLGGIRRSQGPRRIVLVVLLLTGLGGAATLTGCGGGGGNSGNQVTSQPQTYTITVTAASGALSHSTTVTLTVQ